MTHDALADAFVAKLTALGYAPRPGLTDMAMDAEAARHEWTLPAPVRAYLRRANGCTHGCWHGGLGVGGIWDFHPLEQWSCAPHMPTKLFARHVTGPDAGPHRLALFADALIDCPAYALALHTDSPIHGDVILRDGDPDTLSRHLDGGFGRADFADFMRGFLNDPEDSFPTFAK